jgi:polycystin 1L2
MSKLSATMSKVFFSLSGDDIDSGTRQLRDGERKLFERSTEVKFIMSTAESLGHLTYIRVWHDNSGKGSHASWFLDKITVLDLQTRQRYNHLNSLIIQSLKCSFGKPENNLKFD